jgi:hypothetical protein
MPFDVLVEGVPDEKLGPLLTQIGLVGVPSPVITPVDAGAGARASRAAAPMAAAALPTEWRLLKTLDDQTYRWPEYPEHYNPYEVYAAETPREGTVRIALGFASRPEKWGRTRRYIVAFLTGGTPATPLVEYLEADDFEQTREYLAIIRGRDGGRKMYGPTDTLPDVYTKHFTTQMYRDRIDYPGVWNKAVVVVREDDTATLLNHALVQARRRGDL